MELIYRIFYSCLRLLDVEINPGRRRLVPAVCRILCSNVRRLAGNLGDLTVASSQYDILLCCETLVSDMRHVSELLKVKSSMARSLPVENLLPQNVDQLSTTYSNY